MNAEIVILNKHVLCTEMVETEHHLGRNEVELPDGTVTDLRPGDKWGPALDNADHIEIVDVTTDGVQFEYPSGLAAEWTLEEFREDVKDGNLHPLDLSKNHGEVTVRFSGGGDGSPVSESLPLEIDMTESHRNRLRVRGYVEEAYRIIDTAPSFDHIDAEDLSASNPTTRVTLTVE